MVGEDILLEIDGTLDQLIRNAEAMEHVEITTLSETEIDAFQKTQESLLHHLIRMDEAFAKQRNQLKVMDKRSASYKIREKMLRFEKMKDSYHQGIIKAKAKVPILSKRKAKRFFASKP